MPEINVLLLCPGFNGLGEAEFRQNPASIDRGKHANSPRAQPVTVTWIAERGLLVICTLAAEVNGCCMAADVIVHVAIAVQG